MFEPDCRWDIMKLFCPMYRDFRISGAFRFLNSGMVTRYFFYVIYLGINKKSKHRKVNNHIFSYNFYRQSYLQLINSFLI